MRLNGLLTLAAALLFVAAPALGDDFNPPPWRGEWSTTSQYWEFKTNDPGPLIPDGIPAGGQTYLESTELTVTPGPSMGWLEEDEGRYGVWQLSGWIDVIVDNHDPKPENEKWIWIQLTWRPQELGSIPGITVTDPAGVQIGPVGPIVETNIGPFDWMHSTYEIILDHNPEWEAIFIDGTINVDELVIDTWCVPEPATMAMLAIGGLAVLRRRRR